MTEIAEGEFYASVSLITGKDPLNYKLRAYFANVRATLEDDVDDTAPGTAVVLGSSTNRVDQLRPSYILEGELGKAHAVILPAALVKEAHRDYFPHGKEFTKRDAPALEPFFGPDAKNAKHVVGP